MLHTGFLKNGVDAGLGHLHGVVGGGKHHLHAIVAQGLCGQCQIIGGGAGFGFVLNAQLVQAALGFLNGLGAGILAGIVQKADLGHIGVQCLDQVKHIGGIQCVRGAGDVGAGGVQIGHQACAHRVRHSGEHHGDLVFFGEVLHHHSRGRCNGNDHIHAVFNHLAGNGGNGGLVGLCVVAVIADAVCSQLFLNGGLDLVQAGIVHIVDDANFKAGAFCP